METMFKFQSDVKEEFLETKTTGTAKTNSYVLKSSDEYEFMLNKPIYNMSIFELKELLSAQFKNSSIGVLETNISILRKYIDFCKEKGLVYHMENRLAIFSRRDVEELVSQQAIEFRYITKEKLQEYKSLLANNQDKLLLELPFYGIRGRTQEEGTLEEIINLNYYPEYETSNTLLLIKNNGELREVVVPKETMDLIKATFDDEFYVDNNGKETKNERVSTRNITVNKVKNTVFRVPGKDKFQYFESNLINSRMHRIQEWIGNEYVNVTSLYYSGMINMAKEMLEKSGTIDYDLICEQFDYSKDYLFKLKNMVDMYIDKPSEVNNA